VLSRGDLVLRCKDEDVPRWSWLGGSMVPVASRLGLVFLGALSASEASLLALIRMLLLRWDDLCLSRSDPVGTS